MLIHGPGSVDWKPPVTCGCDGRGEWRLHEPPDKPNGTSPDAGTVQNEQTLTPAVLPPEQQEEQR